MKAMTIRVNPLDARPGGGWGGGEEDTVLRIGLVNNMPDSALERTERQFFRLLGSAAPELSIRWYLFSLRGIPRSVGGNLHLLRQYYGSVSDLYRTEVDALIVTGAEPHQTDIRREPYWSELTELFDWIDCARWPAVFSCLAAHAAVLHFDGLARQRLTEKRFGLFDHATVAKHRLTAALAAPVPVAHSRWNELTGDALGDAGYRVLTYAPEAGADLFVNPQRDDLLFFQGHPEYEADTLAREYRRDVRRFLAGASERYPELPQNYFSDDEVNALTQFRERALYIRDERLLDNFPGIVLRSGQKIPPMAPVFGAWLRQIDDAKAERLGLQRKQRHLAGLQVP
jgi:homoserine O-succinyltransferase